MRAGGVSRESEGTALGNQEPSTQHRSGTQHRGGFEINCAK